MADIAFLLLIFFLMTTTTSVDTGLLRRLPPMPDASQRTDGVDVRRRNVLELSLDGNDRLSVGSRQTDASTLKDAVKEFVRNPSDDVLKSEKEMKAIDGLGMYPVSKAVISLQHARSTSYKAYVEVQNEVAAAFHDLRDTLALSHFGKAYALLDADRQRSIRQAIPQNISEAEPADVDVKKERR
jgi:biopolymer transport protein ExbD